MTLLKRQPTCRAVGKNAYRPHHNLAHGIAIGQSYDESTTMKRYIIPIGAFLIGCFLLAGVYLGFLTWSQDWRFALSQFARDRSYIVPIVIAFGIQSALFSILRFRVFVPVSSTGPSGAVMGASGGTSATAMVACCIHHVANVLPILGLSAATAFLARYQQPFLQVSLAVNLLGIAGMLAILYRAQRRTQFILKTS